jgi:hypothetical protein
MKKLQDISRFLPEKFTIPAIFWKKMKIYSSFSKGWHPCGIPARLLAFPGVYGKIVVLHSCREVSWKST